VVGVLTVLTIGGSDPTGGAGLQADLQTVASLGAHGAAAVTAVTVQDTSRVYATHGVPADWVAEQLARLLADVRVHAAKTGMLATGAIVRVVAEVLSEHGDVPVVVDPVIRSTSGHMLLDEDGVRELRQRLLPRAWLVTPNLMEAALLTGQEVRSVQQMAECARTIAEMGAGAVVVKGGHSRGEPVDVLYADGEATEIPGQRVPGVREVHGTGCAFSAAAAVFAARGHDTLATARMAKAYVAAGLRNAVAVGGGARVIDHQRAAAALLP
jgi:hydroxymethylpyrimidine/phosphomethylpyrimidine kinase